MAGFLDNSKEQKPEGLYAQLVGHYVKLWVPGGTVAGKIIKADHRSLQLLPHVVAQNYEFRIEAYIETETPAVVLAEAVHCAQPIKDGEKYLETIVSEIKGENEIRKLRKEKELKNSLTSSPKNSQSI